MNEEIYRSMGYEKTMTSSSSAASQPELGRIDQYTLKDELGGGGFGTVYRAVDTTSGVDVAVKGLPPLLRNNREEMENVRRNFALVSRLHHPNIAAALVLHPVHDVQIGDPHIRECLRVAPGDTLMVMEYARGVTLSQWRKQFPDWKVPLADAMDICGQIAAALDYAHERSIVHRDIKPANVMVETGLDGKRTARVLDFGLAAEIRSSISRVSMEVRDTSGTRPYMAPEQWLGQRQGPATDQYSLAVLVCELLTGEVPFSSVFDTGDPVVMMNAVGHEEPDIDPKLQGKTLAVLRKALAKKPEERYGSCTEFIAALGGGKIRAEVASVKSNSVKRPAAGGGKPTAVKAAAALLLAGIAVGGFFGYRAYRRARQELAAEVCLLEAKASQAQEKNATAEWNGVELFRSRSKELEGYFRAGKQAFERGELETAKTYFGKVRDDWYWLSSNFTARAEALAEKSKVEALRARGERVQAASVGAEDWRKADSAFMSAELSMREGAFAAAQSDYRRSGEMFVGVVQRAEREQVVKDTAAAKLAFKENRYVEAFRLSQTADQTDRSINFQLAWLYEHGNGVGKDEAKALEYYRKAEELGSFAATRNIGLLYENGAAGLTKDLKTAVAYYQRAVDGGDVLAHQFLANMYEFGKGVERDYERARKLYAEADASGCEGVKKMLERVDRKISARAETDQALQAFRAQEWETGWRHAQNADQDDRDIQFYLGVCYDFGHAVAVDKQAAVRWYRKAAAQDERTAQYNLGNMYRNGSGVEKNYAEAMRWMQKAWANGEDTAAAIIGVMYEKGEGVEKDLAKAIEYYRKGVEKEDTLSMRFLGLSYENGDGVEKDFARAVDLYRRAMEKGDDHAKAFLADMYEKGKGVAKDMAMAMKLYREAAAKQVDYAIKALNRLESNVDFGSSDARARQREGQQMLGIDFETPFQNGPTVTVSSGEELQQTFASCASGTTIRLKAGRFEVSSRLCVPSSKRIKIVGVSPDETVVAGPKYLFDAEADAMLVLENITARAPDWSVFTSKNSILAIFGCRFEGSKLKFVDGSKVLMTRTQIDVGREDWGVCLSENSRLYMSDVVVRNAGEHAFISFKNSRSVIKNCDLTNPNRGTVVRANGENILIYMENTKVRGGEYGIHIGSRGSYSLKNIKFEDCSTYGIEGMSDMPVVDTYGCTFKNVATRYEKPEKVAEKSTSFSVNTGMLK